MVWRALLFSGCLTVAFSKIYFEETFDDDSWEERWITSKHKAKAHSLGSFVLHKGADRFRNETEESGLMTVEDHRHFSISAKFPNFTCCRKKEKLIIQFQVKYTRHDKCGGGYIKLGPPMEDPEDFHDETPYNVMFGPDECGYRRITQAIFEHRGIPHLKKKDVYYTQWNWTSHVYRLVIRSNGQLTIDCDEVNLYNGDLKEDWEMLGPSEIHDPRDKKPKDWVDESYIIDPRAAPKPDDWVDEKRVKDYDSKAPDDWDEAEDGPWEYPMKDNPEWRGAWRPHKVWNPEYKGYWEPRLIPNPEYKDDPTVGVWNFGWVGFDLWQTNAGSIFDNIIVCTEYDEANAYIRKWRRIKHIEKEHMSRAYRKAKKRFHDLADLYDDDDDDFGLQPPDKYGDEDDHADLVDEDEDDNLEEADSDL